MPPTLCPCTRWSECTGSSDMLSLLLVGVMGSETTGLPVERAVVDTLRGATKRARTPPAPFETLATRTLLAVLRWRVCPWSSCISSSLVAEDDEQSSEELWSSVSSAQDDASSDDVAPLLVVVVAMRRTVGGTEADAERVKMERLVPCADDGWLGYSALRASEAGTDADEGREAVSGRLVLDAETEKTSSDE